MIYMEDLNSGGWSQNILSWTVDFCLQDGRSGGSVREVREQCGSSLGELSAHPVCQVAILQNFIRLSVESVLGLYRRLFLVSFF
jgi:hypothetical protein